MTRINSIADVRIGCLNDECDLSAQGNRINGKNWDHADPFCCQDRSIKQFNNNYKNI